MKKHILFIVFFFPLFVNAQPVSVKEVDNGANFPAITWYTVGAVDTTDFRVFRAKVKDKIFKEINTVHSAFLAQTEKDTSFFFVTDTTLTEKAIYLYYVSVKRAGKEVISETALGHNFGYIPSPRVVEMKAVPAADRKAVTLNWKLSYPQTVSSLTLYRSLHYDTGYIKVADLSPDMFTFTDVVPVANEPLFYTMVIHTYFGAEITGVRVPAFATFAEKPVKPVNIHGVFRNDSVLLDWTNVGKNIIGYRVFRSIEGKPYFLINDMGNGTSGKIVFTDSGNEVKKSVRISYYVVNVSDGFVESNHSDTLSFYLAGHEPVLPPSEADHITDDNGNVKLLWVQPEKGLTTGYNVYLTDESEHTVKLNERVLTKNYFTDTVYRTAGKYRYEIEGVGFNNKTSDLRTPVTVYRYPPKIHVIVDLKKGPGGIVVSWKRLMNKHVRKVLLYKKTGNEKPLPVKSFSPDVDVSITDSNVLNEKTYLYKLVVKMTNGDEVVANDGVQIIY